METLIGFLSAAIALLAIVVLYFGGAATVLRLVDRLRSPHKTSEGGSNATPAAT